jgi:hypothetical protein
MLLQSPLPPACGKHATSDLIFTLVVDDFGIKYTNKADAKQLMMGIMLKDLYSIIEDWTGVCYCDLTIEWDYRNHSHHGVSILGYIKHTL